mmetsp:Transcript_753/g.1370  ORF Transcript_753/g.1370 Transcript_753/m.1370 type:complete len:210 (+) Transcript_753:355-984(+)
MRALHVVKQLHTYDLPSHRTRRQGTSKNLRIHPQHRVAAWIRQNDERIAKPLQLRSCGCLLGWSREEVGLERLGQALRVVVKARHKFWTATDWRERQRAPVGSSNVQQLRVSFQDLGSGCDCTLVLLLSLQGLLLRSCGLGILLLLSRLSDLAGVTLRSVLSLSFVCGFNSSYRLPDGCLQDRFALYGISKVERAFLAVREAAAGWKLC